MVAPENWGVNAQQAPSGAAQNIYNKAKEATATAAVSTRKTRFPRPRGTHPAASNAAVSASVQPPSGPMAKAAAVVASGIFGSPWEGASGCR